jgi:hypothetical protein
VSALIPKRLIQTAKRADFALKQRAFNVNLRLLHPDFEWRFFDDRAAADFVANEFAEYVRVFEGFRFPIQRYDFFRYLAVFRLGGFYFDLDVLLAHSVSMLCEHRCVFPFEGLTFSRLLRNQGMDWELGNFAFGAAPGDPFLAAVIDNCVRAQREPAWVRGMMPGVPALSRGAHEVLYSTGPGLLSRTMVENPHLASGVTVLFPEDVCDPQSWNRFGEFGVHLMEGSWRGRTSLIRRRLGQRIEAFQVRELVRQGKMRGRLRSVPAGGQ